MLKKETIGIIMLIIFIGFFQCIKSFYVSNSIVNKNVFEQNNGVSSKTSAKFNQLRSDTEERYLVVYDKDEINSKLIRDNLQMIFKYMKKNVNILNVSDKKPDLSVYSGIVVAFENLDGCSYVNELFDYCQKGGSLVFAEKVQAHSYNYGNIYRNFGIVESGTEESANTIKFNTNLLLKANGFTAKVSDFTTIPVQLDDKCTVHCTTANGNPLVWERDVGKGKFLFANGQFTSSKDDRGILAAMISVAQGSFIYPVINAKVEFIDDFPAPVLEKVNSEIFKQYGVTTYQYYRNYWWPDMLAIAKKYNLKYSTYVIESYNDKMKPEFDFERTRDNINNAIVFGREILKSGGEIGLHGYNHQPFAFKDFITENLGYKSWKTEADMMASVKEANQFMKEAFPDYTMRSYVPPSNILSPEGRTALMKQWPQLKVISGVYNAAEKDVYKQEFEVAKDGIIEFPRASSGYFMTDTDKWSIYNGATINGVFSHFVHPDDILDIDRHENKNWEELKKSFEGIACEINGNFPWLRPLTISEAGVELKRYDKTEVEFEYTDEGINGYCSNFKQFAYFILRTGETPGNCTNCEVTKIDGDAYLIKANDCEFNIRLDGKK